LGNLGLQFLAQNAFATFAEMERAVRRSATVETYAPLDWS
jgi:hypothetical protein